MKIIHTENLTRTYHMGNVVVNALCAVDLEVEAGDFLEPGELLR